MSGSRLKRVVSEQHMANVPLHWAPHVEVALFLSVSTHSVIRAGQSNYRAANPMATSQFVYMWELKNRVVMSRNSVQHDGMCALPAQNFK